MNNVLKQCFKEGNAVKQLKLDQPVWTWKLQG